MVQCLLHDSRSSCSADMISRGKASTTLIDLSLCSTSISAEAIGELRSLSPSGQCCGPSKPAETIMPVKEPEEGHASVRARATTNTQLLPNHDDGARRRERVKRFMAEKGPRIAGAAAAIGMFIFNVVTSCS